VSDQAGRNTVPVHVPLVDVPVALSVEMNWGSPLGETARRDTIATPESASATPRVTVRVLSPVVVSTDGGLTAREVRFGETVSTAAGLVTVTFAVATPETASVACSRTSTSNGPPAELTVVGVTLRLTRAGAVVSTMPVTVAVRLRPSEVSSDAG